MEDYSAKSCFQMVKNGTDSAFGASIQKIRKEELFVLQIECQNTFYTKSLGKSLL